MAQQIKACWLFGKNPCEVLPLQKYRGLWDFRGLDLNINLPPVIALPDGERPQMKRLSKKDYWDPTMAMVNTRFADCDFSFACLEDRWFERCTFENVLFRGANGCGIHDQASLFRRVDFTRSQWRGSGLGMNGARYENCIFANTDLRYVSFYGGYFTDCHFLNAKWSNDVSFEGSHFLRCKLSGKIKGIFFKDIEDELVKSKCGCEPIESNSPVDLDLSEAQIKWIVIIGEVDVSQVVLPKKGNFVLIKDWPSGLNTLRKTIERSWGAKLTRKRLLGENSKSPSIRGKCALFPAMNWR